MKLEYKIETINTLADRSKEIILDIRPECQIYVGYLLEGLDGHCYHTIIDYPVNMIPDPKNKRSGKKRMKMMKITVSPDFFPEVRDFLSDLQGYEI